MKKVRRYMEEHYPFKIAFVYGLVVGCFVVAIIQLPTYAVLFAIIMCAILISSFIFMMVVANKTDKWWQEEGSKETK